MFNEFKLKKEVYMLFLWIIGIGVFIFLLLIMVWALFTSKNKDGITVLNRIIDLF